MQVKRPLSTRQKLAIEGLAAGFSIDEIAGILQIKPEVISRWRRTNRQFREALRDRRADPAANHPMLLRMFTYRLNRPEAEREWEDESGGTERE